MKKLKAILLAALVLSIAAIIAVPMNAAAAQEEMTIIYVQVPESWETPRVWAWGPRGDAFPAWPGGEMLPDANNPDWYFIHIPADKTGALISANIAGTDDRVQTSDFPLDGEPIWGVVWGEGDSFDFTHEQQTVGDLPQPLMLVAVFAQVPDNWDTPRAWAWGPRGDAFPAWPGGEMQPVADNPGWYYIYLPSDKTGALVSADIAGTEDREQTSDFPFDGTPVWVTISGEGEDFDYTNEQQTTGDFTAFLPYVAEEELTLEVVYLPAGVIYAFIPEHWENPRVWAWGPRGDAFDEWPGGEMSPDPNNPGWYYAFIPDCMVGALVSADIGDDEREQTSDLTFTGQTIWVTIHSYNNFEYTTDQQTEGDVPVLEGGFPFLAPEEPDEAPDVGYITVRAFIPDTWENPGVWAWNDDYGNVFPGWPGQPFTEMDGDWHVMELPGWVNEIIINAAGVQTEDMETEMGDDIWIIVMGYRHSYLFNEAVDPHDLAALGIEEPERVEVVFGPVDDDDDDEDEDEPEPPAVVEDDDSGAPVGLIVGIVAAVVAAIGACAAVIFRKKKKLQ